MSEGSPIAVVTGGSAGIGWAVGQRLAADGFRVIAADVQPGFTADSEEVLWRKMDVTDHQDVRDVFEEIVDEFGGIDVLVNNAGIQRHNALEDIGWDEWVAIINVNLHGVFNSLQAGGRHMLSRGSGCIVNISSVSARGAAGRAAYSTTKAALLGLTATAGAEWASRGVRVNAVAPGYVNTGVFREGVDSGRLDVDTILARIPMERLADPKEIAAAISYLISEDASYMTGQTIYVDGGFMVDYGVPVAKKDLQ